MRLSEFALSICSHPVPPSQSPELELQLPQPPSVTAISSASYISEPLFSLSPCLSSRTDRNSVLHLNQSTVSLPSRPSIDRLYSDSLLVLITVSTSFIFLSSPSVYSLLTSFFLHSPSLLPPFAHLHLVSSSLLHPVFLVISSFISPQPPSLRTPHQRSPWQRLKHSCRGSPSS